ncbi:MAG: polynucleotide kinase-phosphatase [Actinomycetota bacterium]|nr:polynucleotide kinase-phosphatase [Actinomycetota bacterium]
MKIAIPELSLVALVGVSGSGKSTFASGHFLPTEIVSSDLCRGLVGDDENDQSVTAEAFELLHVIATKRLALGRLTVVDATNVQPESRKPLVALARDQHVLPIAIVFDLPEQLCAERNSSRSDRQFGPHVLRGQRSQLKRSLRGLEREGFRRVFVLHSPEDVASVEITREPAWTDRRGELGPFDLVGDVHGCFDELVELMGELGWQVDTAAHTASHPDGRKLVFLGDLVDRGPKTPDVLRLAMSMVGSGDAICVPGNHENKLVRALKGRNVQVTHGLGETLDQLKAEPPEFSGEVLTFLDGLISHFVLDEGRLVVAHAGMREEMQGRASGAVRSFALYGETTGETDEFGLPVRYPWAEEYRGKAAVVYGHTPTPEPEWINNTICLDTGCAFGGRLTALRYPERELVTVAAHATYYDPIKPLAGAIAPGAERPAEVLDIDDVLGRRGVETRLAGRLTIPEENAAAALEVMSRWAVDPRWLIYLPPTMAPVATTEEGVLLEHPQQAFNSFRRDGVAQVICEEKHMGSRAVVVVCRTPEVAAQRFGDDGERSGVAYTRTGREFFTTPELRDGVLDHVRSAIDAAGLWESLETDWLALDCELLPWSAKAEDLLRTQYAAVGAAATNALAASTSMLEEAVARGIAVEAILERTRSREAMADLFVDAYRQYVWPVASIADIRLAPFQILAGEGKTFLEREHTWQMETIERLCGADKDFFRMTANALVDVTDVESQADGVRWWEAITADGGEGMVVKPNVAISRGRKGIVQPGVKVRGPEYLRIIYGPEYTEPHNLERLRKRGIGRKRSLAQREFALGVEALERVVRGEPLYRVHECVFGVLALESEPVDPRL